MTTQAYQVDNNQVIHNVIVASGFFMAIASLVGAAQFYWSMGGSPLESSVYVFVGVTIQMVVIVLPGIIVTSVQHNKIFKACISGLFFLLLFAMQMFAGYGFFAKSQAHLEENKAVASLGYLNAKARLDAANAKLESMSSNASVDIAGLTSKIDKLTAKKTALQVDLSKCPKNHKTNCINPKTAEITAVNEDIAKLESQLGSGQGYKSVLSERAAAMQELQSVAESKGTSTSHINAVFTMAERLTGIAARDIQAGVMAIIPFIIEFWCMYAAYLHMVGVGNYTRDMSIYNTTSPTAKVAENPIKNVTPEPQQLTEQPPKKDAPKYDFGAVNYNLPKVVWTDTQPVKKA